MEGGREEKGKLTQCASGKEGETERGRDGRRKEEGGRVTQSTSGIVSEGMKGMAWSKGQGRGTKGKRDGRGEREKVGGERVN